MLNHLKGRKRERRKQKMCISIHHYCELFKCSSFVWQWWCRSVFCLHASAVRPKICRNEIVRRRRGEKLLIISICSVSVTLATWSTVADGSTGTRFKYSCAVRLWSQVKINSSGKIHMNFYVVIIENERKKNE